MTLLIVLALIAGVVGWGIAIYNGLVSKRTMTEEGWSGIETQLKRRSDLIPNLVETVKGYATHEQSTFETVTEMRAKAFGASTPAERAAAESQFSQAIGSLMAVAENYPELRASENFQSLQEDLAEIENEINMARRYYNGTVRQLNIAVDSFPSNLIAQNFGFTKAEFFEIEDEADRAVPKISFEA